MLHYKSTQKFLYTRFMFNYKGVCPYNSTVPWLDLTQCFGNYSLILSFMLLEKVTGLFIDLSKTKGTKK